MSAAIIGAAALLFTYVTARFTLSGGDALGITIVGSLTAGLWYHSWRWYRRAAAVSSPAQVPDESGAAARAGPDRGER